MSIAGSLASGGFRASDDVDLNLIVDDGHRHLAYVAVNLLGLAHALRHRDKPVDDLTRRPVAPRLMTANLILERAQCLPLARQDEDMAFELLVAEPVFGLEPIDELIEANPGLVEHFPQLADKPAPLRDRACDTPPAARLLSPSPGRRGEGGGPDAPGATCSGRAGDTRRRSPGLRMSARRCAPTRCSTS